MDKQLQSYLMRVTDVEQYDYPAIVRMLSTMHDLKRLARETFPACTFETERNYDYSGDGSGESVSLVVVVKDEWGEALWNKFDEFVRQRWLDHPNFYGCHISLNIGSA